MRLYEFAPTRSIRVRWALQELGVEFEAIPVDLVAGQQPRGLLPADLAERAEGYRWLLFAATELEQPLWRISRHTSLYPEHERLPADVALASREFREMAAVLDARLRGRAFVVGDAPSVADLVLAYTLDRANEAGLLGDFPELLGSVERMYARPHAPPRIADALASVGIRPAPMG